MIVSKSKLLCCGLKKTVSTTVCMLWNFNLSIKGQLNYLFSHSCSLPFPTMPPCSLQAGVTVCGHHCPVGPAGFPSAGLSSVLPVQSEEEGQEGCCSGKDRPERWQRGWGRGLQTGWRDKCTTNNVNDNESDDDIMNDYYMSVCTSQVVQNITKLSEESKHSQADNTEKSQSTEVDIKVRICNISLWILSLWEILIMSAFYTVFCVQTAAAYSERYL